MMTATPPTAASNAELLRWVFEKLNEHDLAPLVEHFWTNDAVESFPDRTCHGADQIRAYFEEKYVAVPDLQMEVIAVVEENDDVIVHWRLTGTHEGPLLGIVATHKQLKLDGIDHFVLRDRHPVSATVVFDQMSLARQLGMMPPDGSAADTAIKTAFNAFTRILQKLRRRSTATPRS